MGRDKIRSRPQAELFDKKVTGVNEVMFRDFAQKALNDTHLSEV